MNNNSNPAGACRLPAGYIAITTKEYRENIEELTNAESLIKVQEIAVNTLEELLKETAEENREMKAQLDEIDRFFFEDKYCEDCFKKFREKQQAKKAEADNAEDKNT